ncbi:MAG: 3-oxoadipyl-CoA thiolase [Proteobacteria bacterium]|jgi:acetyl-CoA acyltransferase|nr:3-oxoadipyl-CoA thiolase [Pseudomonadota bacterium]MDA1134975.1 3-oxoadipyl-CoA thiolase [Pseudomonadota bacterium]|tara:strand:- start:876 stop:2078 length:1203 start_codon:yes stop_codon:yes gene_type:complete
MTEALICEGTRTPIGKFGGKLSSIRTDDLASLPLISLKKRLKKVDWDSLEEVFFGNANQAGEDNRNIARMALLLAGLPYTVSGITLNRLCASGMEAISNASRMIKANEAEFTIAGGVESMSRAPFVMPKANSAFSRNAEIYDTTIGWRFINPKMKLNFGVDSMPETAENVAEKYQINREDQDKMALSSQIKAIKSIQNGRLAKEITPVEIPQRKGDPIIFDKDEHPRETTIEKLSALPTPFRPNGSVTAGNASGINDGAAAIIIANENGVKRNHLLPRARILSAASCGVEPAFMGIGPVPATIKALKLAGLSMDDIDIIEINEAFAAQGLASLRSLGVSDDDERVNPNGGAIALGHPLGMSGTRLVLTATQELMETNKKYALCTMCVGVGQGSAIIIEKL